MSKQSDIAHASYFAYKKHDGQTRKYTGEIYWFHPHAVAQIIEKSGGTVAMIQAAYLHDILEDTDTNFEELRDEFGIEVAHLVWELTDVFTHAAYPAFCRATRKKWECQRLADIHPDAKKIKLADIADNTKSIVEHDPKFAIVYLREKADMLEVLT